MDRLSHFAISIAMFAPFSQVHGHAADLSIEAPAANIHPRVWSARTPNYLLDLRPTGLRFLRTHSSQRLRVRFAHANPKATAQPGSALPAQMNYYFGNDPSKWRRGVNLWDSVSFLNIYPGIDVSYHAASQREAGAAIEYDFRLAPGADARQIRVAFEGDVSVRMASDGSVVGGNDPSTGKALQLQKAPAAYQMISTGRVDIPVRVVNAGHNQISFVLGAHDDRAAVIIDPVLVYSTYFGGSGSDEGNGVTMDGAGNVYVTGDTSSANFPVDPTSNKSHGGTEIFVSKFDPSGKLLFSTLIGGGANDEGRAIDLDAAGNILVAGSTNSTNFPVLPASAFQTALDPGGYGVAFALKLDGNGNLLASTYLGGRIPSATCGRLADAYGVSHDATGNVYVTGQTCADDFPVQAPVNSRLLGADACFVTEFAPTLETVIYSTYLGGTQFDFCNAIAVDSAASAYVVGATASSGLATAGAFQSTSGGGPSYGDAFVAKILAGGKGLAYYTYLGGSEDDGANGIRVDSAGNAYVTGWTQSSNFPLKNPLQAVYGGGGSGAVEPCGCPGGDAFVAELNPTGTALVYSTYFGSTGLESGETIAIDSSGRAYVAGGTTSTNLKTTPGAFQTKLGGAENGFLLEIAPQGTAIDYATYMGGAKVDSIYSIAASNSGNVFMTGITQSPNFPTAQALQSALNGSQNAFVAEIATPLLTISAVANGASFTDAPAVSPGSLCTLFAATNVSEPTFASSTPLPAILADVSVMINGIAAPLLYVDSKQVNFQIPNEIPAGPATAVLVSNGATSFPFSFTVSTEAPGILTYGNNQVVAQNFPSLVVNGPGSPIAAGGTVTVYLTGIGPVTNTVADGVAAPNSPLSMATESYSATINQIGASVLFVGLAPEYVGLDQANITVPAGLAAGTYPLVITVGGQASNSVSISVQ